MENYEKFEKLLNQYSFAELTAEDRQLVDRFVNSEEEYEALRQTQQRIADHFSKPSLVPHPQVWSRIKMSRVAASKAVNGSFWTKPFPAYVTMLLLIFVGSVCWYGGSREYTKPIVRLETRTDTIRIASKPDIIMKERIIYVQQAIMPQAVRASAKTSPEVSPKKGVNMKEKEELEELLVTGSM